MHFAKTITFVDKYKHAYCVEKENIRKIAIVKTKADTLYCHVYLYQFNHIHFDIVKDGRYKKRKKISFRCNPKFFILSFNKNQVN